MKVIIAIALIGFGSYFVYDAGKTIYSPSETVDSLEYESDGQYQEIVTYEGVVNNENKQTYIFLIIGIVLIISGGVLLYLKRKQ